MVIEGLTGKKNMVQRIIVYLTIVFLTVGVYSAAKRKAAIISSKCVGCADCIRICPKDAVEMRKGKVFIDLEQCNGCSLCYTICSYNAIRIMEK
jgi:NAD-dependent dihydropyrimidine dehydrogenase PreA subunit